MDLVRVKLEDGTETTVGAAFAKSHNLKVLDKPAVDRVGRTIRTKYPVRLRGGELDTALDAAGLSKTGSADEKRERLAVHLQASGTPVGEALNPGGESAQSEEDSQ